jgi:hypothetical protein
LVLTLMLRRIKVLPLGLGEEVVEDSLDFLFEVPASMRAARRPESYESRRRRPSPPRPGNSNRVRIGSKSTKRPPTSL